MLVDSFISYLPHGIKTRGMCLRHRYIEGKGSHEALDAIAPDVLVHHEFDAWSGYHSLPDHSILIVDWFEGYKGALLPEDHLHYMENLFANDGLPLSIERILFINRTVTDETKVGSSPLSEPTQMLTDEKDEFKSGMDALVDGVNQILGKHDKSLQWEYIKGEPDEIQCEGCNRKSSFILMSTRLELTCL